MKILVTALAISIATITTQTMAQQPLQAATPLSTVELNTIFDSSQLDNLQATELSNQEMKDTQGAVLPLYALGIFAMGTGRFIATQYVSRTIAVNAARSGCNVMCYGTAQQARNLATQAYGPGNVMRHGPSHHQRHVDYSHFQSRTGTPSGHIFYGKNYPR